MRVANEHNADLTRKSLDKEPIRKFFIIPEGDNTEQQYFNGIDKNREEIGINSLIEICLLENEEDEHGQSHPLRKLENFNKFLNQSDAVYDSEIDKVCFVVDRDPKNFFTNQFFEFVKKTGESGYEVYISNPTFELFLLMHDDRIFELDREEMLKNDYTTPAKKKRFLTKILKDFFECEKEKIKFEKFKDNIDKAIKNEKEFEENVFELENKLGSNVGKLLEEMKK